jgi:predicted nucleotidyltransferase
LELPYPYSSSVAEQFALGAVSILHDLGVVDHLIFGSECADIEDLLVQVARRFSLEFEKLIAEKRKENPSLPYPKLIDMCYSECYGQNFAVGPNDILGIYYLKALRDLDSDIIPMCHARLVGASATNSRRLLKEGNLSGIPDAAKCFFEKPHSSLEKGSSAILYSLRSVSDSRIASAASQSTVLHELYEKLGNKNMTDARIRRDVLHSLLSYRENEFTLPKFTTVLSMNKRGAGLLHEIKKKSKLEIVTKPSDYRQNPEVCSQFERNLKADALYSICSDPILPQYWSLCKSPYVKK